MLRTLVLGVLGLLVVFASMRALTAWRARDEARVLAIEAEQVLRTPLARAPEIAGVDATRALALLEQAEKLHADPAAAPLLQWAHALDELRKNRIDLAENAWSAAGHRFADDADFLALGAAIAVQRGERAQGSARLARARELAPRHARARLLAADLAADAGRAAEARDLLTQLLSELTNVGTLYNRRGLALEATGDREGARADFAQAATLDPSLPQPHINLGRLLRDEGRLREAEQEFGLAIARGAAEAQAWLGRGLVRIARGDLEGGRGDVEQARAFAPAEPGPLLALADLDAWHGQLDRAIERYRAALALGDADAVAWLKLGNALTRSQQYEPARAAFDRALALSPNLAAAHNGLGAALMGLGDATAAESAFATAAALDRHDPNPARNLALLRRRGREHAARPRTRAREPRAALD